MAREWHAGQATKLLMQQMKQKAAEEAARRRREAGEPEPEEDAASSTVTESGKALAGTTQVRRYRSSENTA